MFSKSIRMEKIMRKIKMKYDKAKCKGKTQQRDIRNLTRERGGDYE